MNEKDKYLIQLYNKMYDSMTQVIDDLIELWNKNLTFSKK